MAIFKLQDGTRFYQWDVKRKLIVTDYRINQVHFTNATLENAIVQEVYEEEGDRLVDVPAYLLECDCNITAYAYIQQEDKEYTLLQEVIGVTPRKKPDDYIPEEELYRWTTLKEEVLAAAERASVSEQEAKAAVESIGTSLQEAQTAAEEAEESKTGAESAASAAWHSAEAAANAASAAAGSATTAAESEQVAITSASTATTKAEEAAASAEAAEASAKAAGTSEANAVACAAAAKESEDNAKASENNAAKSETAGAGYKAAAEQSAAAAANSATEAKAAELNAEGYAGSAASSATASASSESAAKTSETNASESAATATSKATEAANSATAAENAKTAAEAAQAAAEQAKGEADVTCVAITIPAGRMKGDIDGDGKITQADYDLAYKHVSKAALITDETQLACADIDGNGKIVMKDASMISELADGANVGSRSSDILNNWTVNPNYETEEAQFYTEITVDGITATSSAIITVKGVFENGFFTKAECIDGGIRIFAKLCPITEVTALAICSAANGIATITTEGVEKESWSAADIETVRTNLDVYSKAEVDQLIADAIANLQAI